MRLLVSVRDVDEALQAAAAGAAFIDLKEPRDGALGALPLATIRAVVAALRQRHAGRPVSATVGDFASDAVEPVLARADATAACGVDYVKVGLAAGAARLLDALAASPHPIVPVFIADDGLDWPLLTRACRGRFAAVMLDTADKTRGSLLDVLGDADLRRFLRLARDGGTLAGLAGALRAEQLPRLLALAPDFAGFRSAVCIGARTGRLDPARVARLVAAARVPDPAEAGAA